MSLKVSLIFVYALGPILVRNIRADDTSPDMILRQAISESSPDITLFLHVSEMLYTTMAAENLKRENGNSAVPLWKSILTTLSSSEGAETFKFAVTEIKKIINDDSAQQALINIFATFYTYITHGGDSSGIQLLLRNTILGNRKRNAARVERTVEEMMEETNTDSSQFNITVNSEKGALNEALQEILSEEDDSRSQYRNAPRDLGDEMEKMTPNERKAMLKFGSTTPIESNAAKKKEMERELKENFLFNGKSKPNHNVMMRDNQRFFR